MCSFHRFAIFNTNLQVFEDIPLSFFWRINKQGYFMRFIPRFWFKKEPFTLKWYGVRDIQAVYTNLSTTGLSETFNIVQFSSPKQTLRPCNRGFRKTANESSVLFAASGLKAACLLISELCFSCLRQEYNRLWSKGSGHTDTVCVSHLLGLFSTLFPSEHNSIKNIYGAVSNFRGFFPFHIAQNTLNQLQEHRSLPKH